MQALVSQSAFQKMVNALRLEARPIEPLTKAEEVSGSTSKLAIAGNNSVATLMAKLRGITLDQRSASQQMGAGLL